MPTITKTCALTGKPFIIREIEQGLYEKFNLPLPTICPSEREKRRLVYRNERTLVLDTCDKTGKQIVSMYPKNRTFPVYTEEAWWKDDWDPRDYGRDFDFSRPFFRQFFELRSVVPKQNNGSLQNENSDFTNFTADSKNCYMVIATENSEDCYYCKLCQGNKNCVDCDYIWDSELCYDSINISSCYGCIGSVQLESCSECYFSFDLKGCNDCFGCYNLRNKKYCIENKQYTKEEYENMLTEKHIGSYRMYREYKKLLQEIVSRQAIHRAGHLINCENVVGNNLKNCKNMYMCFDLQDSEDCAYGAEGDAKDSIDFNNVYYKPEYCIELVSALQNNSVFYSMFVYFSHDIWYSDYCFHSKHLFGCVGCKRGEYCILNKQYTKEEYEALVPRIIEQMKKHNEWGEFFPASYSPFGYNETIASEYYPLTREEALKLNFTWRDPDPKDYMPQTCEVPDTVAEADVSITAGILACEKTGKNFKITPQELEFYMSRGLPVPRMHPDERHRVRMKFRSPREIWERLCVKCGTQIKTPYAKERPETVYCEDCYNKEIY